MVNTIAGVSVKRLVTHPDYRGTVTELSSNEWDFHPDPLVYVYAVTIRPGIVKGWIKHELQDDRVAILSGTIQVVLFDDREDSPTYEQVNEFYFSPHNRGLITIPKGVYHALRNVDIQDALFVNMPTKPYNHEKPDKLLLPIENELIPYQFQ